MKKSIIDFMKEVNSSSNKSILAALQNKKSNIDKLIYVEGITDKKYYLKHFKDSGSKIVENSIFEVMDGIGSFKEIYENKKLREVFKVLKFIIDGDYSNKELYDDYDAYVLPVYSVESLALSRAVNDNKHEIIEDLKSNSSIIKELYLLSKKAVEEKVSFKHDLSIDDNGMIKHSFGRIDTSALEGCVICKIKYKRLMSYIIYLFNEVNENRYENNLDQLDQKVMKEMEEYIIC